jgi:hypothetical protein
VAVYIVCEVYVNATGCLNIMLILVFKKVEISKKKQREVPLMFRQSLRELNFLPVIQQLLSSMTERIAYM